MNPKLSKVLYHHLMVLQKILKQSALKWMSQTEEYLVPAGNYRLIRVKKRVNSWRLKCRDGGLLGGLRVYLSCQCCTDLLCYGENISVGHLLTASAACPV